MQVTGGALPSLKALNQAMRDAGMVAPSHAERQAEIEAALAAIGAPDTAFTIDRDEFMEHMRAADATMGGVIDGIEMWFAPYINRPNVVAGTWDCEQGFGTLDLV